MPSHEVIDFEAIKQSVRLSDVLSHYTHVPHREKYRIPCVLHGGDGYNLAIDEDKGLYHCFACGAGGDVVSLYARLEGVSNIEAGRRLTATYSVRSEGGSRKSAAWDELRRWQPKGPLPEVELPENTPLTSYRGYSPEAIKHFDLRLVRNGVLIPCRDQNGRYVGYAVRQINQLPKYLNSKDFKKSEVAYGLFENAAVISERRRVIVCEGQFSAIRVWDTGYKNVVATLGATMTAIQASLLAEYVSKVIVLYDGDDAGRAGAAKIKEDFRPLFHVEIKHLPEGQDPDGADLRILNETE